MINRQEAIDLIHDLSGDEHDWIDCKKDYYVLGLDNKKADFIKDIASMANTITDREKHYLFIGVDDDSGNLVGVNENFDDQSDPRHILGVDEADLQQVLTEYLAPTPNMTLNKFLQQSPKLGVLSIEQIDRKPCTIQKSIDFNGERKLQKGLIFFRSGSSNTIARREEIEQIINERVKKRREYILDGIRKATEIGPEAVATVGDIVHEDEGDIVVEVGEEGDFVMEERFSREPLTDLDQRLNVDMKRWATTDKISLDASTLWEYYSVPNQISIDEESIVFLTLASLKHDVYGIFWLSYIDKEKIREILFSASDGTNLNRTLSKILCAFSDCKGLESFYNEISEDTDIGDFPDYLDLCNKSGNQRIEPLLSKSTYNLNYNTWGKSINLKNADETEIKEMIQNLGSHLQELENRFSGRDKWFHKRGIFRNCLKDCELALAIRHTD